MNHERYLRRCLDWRQRGGCHLVQQRLKEVMVVTIDQRDAHRLFLQRLRRGQAAEPAADDDDMWRRRHRVSL